MYCQAIDADMYDTVQLRAIGYIAKEKPLKRRRMVASGYSPGPSVIVASPDAPRTTSAPVPVREIDRRASGKMRLCLDLPPLF